jgi:hypothetical protein
VKAARVKRHSRALARPEPFPVARRCSNADGSTTLLSASSEEALREIQRRLVAEGAHATGEGLVMDMAAYDRLISVHSVLPSLLADVVAAVLGDAGIEHVGHPVDDPVRAGAIAAEDDEALALLGPLRSRDVAETVEVTAAAELPLIAPMATWVGVTRHDEPGCDDPADHRGTVFRLLARDTVVAGAIADDVRRTRRRAFVIAGRHEYGVQLDGQLHLVDLPRTRDIDEADVLVLCGLAGEPEIQIARSLAPLGVIAFDGVQGADLGDGRDVQLALPFEPLSGISTHDLFAGVEQARRAAELVVELHDAGARERSSVLTALRGLGRFDEFGDPADPAVWLWRVADGWVLEAERRLTTLN